MTRGPRTALRQAVLLDTHTLLWLVTTPEKAVQTARRSFGPKFHHSGIRGLGVARSNTFIKTSPNGGDWAASVGTQISSSPVG